MDVVQGYAADTFVELLREITAGAEQYGPIVVLSHASASGLGPRFTAIVVHRIPTPAPAEGR